MTVFSIERAGRVLWLAGALVLASAWQSVAAPNVVATIKAIATLPGKARIIDLDHTPGLTLLPVRKARGLKHYASAEGEGADEHEHHHGPMDVHFWLDPVNAMSMADYLAQQFAEIDAQHAALYRANAGKLKARLEALDEELSVTLRG